MANLSKVIPGLEAFLEGDVNIDTTVEVPAADAAEEVEDAVAETVEGEEIAAEANETAEKAEMIAAQFEELDAMRDHVAKFGVDRTFLSLCNRDGKLASALGIRMPSCESFDAVGSPTSALSIACMEAFSLKDMWESVKNFVKKLWEKIKAMFGRFVDWVKQLFAGLGKRIKFVKDLRANSIAKENDDVKNVKVQVADPNALKENVADVATLVADATKQFNDLIGGTDTLDKLKAKLASDKTKRGQTTFRSVESVDEAKVYLDVCETVFKAYDADESVVKRVQTNIDDATKKANEDLKTAETAFNNAAENATDKEKLKQAKQAAAAKAKNASIAAKIVIEGVNQNIKSVSKAIRGCVKVLRAFYTPKKK